MKITNKMLYCLLKEGQPTLQIPTISLSIPGYPQTTEAETVYEHPDDWFCILKNERLAVGKEQGFLFWTRKGFLANKEAIKNNFSTTRCSWEYFEAKAEEFFDKIEKNIEKQLKKLENDEKTIRTFLKENYK
jgi:hypothetical protein